MPYDLSRQYALDRARERWPGVEGTVTEYSGGEEVHETIMLYSWQGARTAKMAEIFRGAFVSESDRVAETIAYTRGQVG